MTLPTYVSRETFQAATDTHTPANLADTIDRILQGASRNIEQKFGRHFYPKTESVTWEFFGGGQGFWLNRDLRSITSATVDGDSQTVADIDLYPAQYGPPYSWVGLMGETVVITGEWGYSADTESAGALDGAISDTTGTSADVTDSSKIGVGDLIIIDSERFVVTEKTTKDTTTDLNGALNADVSDVTVTVDDGTQVKAGEIITVDSERMKVISISTNDLTVERAWDGSTLASHSDGASVFAPRTLTITRGALGSTAATHSDATAISRNVPPQPISNLCLAEALVTFQQEHAAYARTIGSGEGEREAGGRGLKDARIQAEGYRRRRLAGV